MLNNALGARNNEKYNKNYDLKRIFSLRTPHVYYFVYTMQD